MKDNTNLNQTGAASRQLMSLSPGSYPQSTLIIRSSCETPGCGKNLKMKWRMDKERHLPVALLIQLGPSRALSFRGVR